MTASASLLARFLIHLRVDEVNQLLIDYYERRRERAIELLGFLQSGGHVNAFEMWAERYIDGLLNPDSDIAVAAGLAAIQDNCVELRVAVAVAFCGLPEISRAAAAATLRYIWTLEGMVLRNYEIVGIFDAVRDARDVLMNEMETATFEALPDVVEIHRGQLFEHGNKVGGNAWTLDRNVAEWYSAPAKSFGGKQHGWVLSTRIRKTAILAVFLERGEKEVVLDVDKINPLLLRAKRGKCKLFPAHLTY